MTQFTGIYGIYAYAKHHENDAVLCIYSQNKEKTDVNMKRFAEVTNGYTKLKNVLTGEISALGTTLSIEGESSNIYELIK